MKESEFLHVGDPCWWKGSFGLDEPKLAEVRSIEVNIDPVMRNGYEKSKLPWKNAFSKRVAVTLHNGHWAYGSQLYRMKIWAKSYDEEI